MTENERKFREWCQAFGFTIGGPHGDGTEEKPTWCIGVYLDGGWIPLVVEAPINDEFWGKALRALEDLTERVLV